ncbi:MAG: hypothetical protein ACRD21_08165, partial [Vicinamibacteria bacterium]
MPRGILQKDLSSSQGERIVAEACDDRRLRGCIDALTALLELPSLGSGRPPNQVVSTLLDAVGMKRTSLQYKMKKLGISRPGYK